MKIYNKSRLPAIRKAVLDLLRHVWKHDFLFQHDIDEVDIWLDSLPTSIREDGASAPDGTPLAVDKESPADPSTASSFLPSFRAV